MQSVKYLKVPLPALKTYLKPDIVSYETRICLLFARLARCRQTCVAWASTLLHLKPCLPCSMLSCITCSANACLCMHWGWLAVVVYCLELLIMGLPSFSFCVLHFCGHCHRSSFASMPRVSSHLSMPILSMKTQQTSSLALAVRNVTFSLSLSLSIEGGT